MSMRFKVRDDIVTQRRFTHAPAGGKTQARSIQIRLAWRPVRPPSRR